MASSATFLFDGLKMMDQKIITADKKVQLLRVTLIKMDQKSADYPALFMQTKFCAVVDF